MDSDTLPLSVSRESLQAHASLKVIKKKIVRKALDTLKKLSDAEIEARTSGGGLPVMSTVQNQWLLLQRSDEGIQRCE